jgi:hypothetical protein
MFEAHFVKVPDECWDWNGCVNADGYAVYNPQHTHQAGLASKGLASRVAYRLYVGEIPPGTEIDHLCQNRRCVCPDHLEPVSHNENVRRRDEHWRAMGVRRHRKIIGIGGSEVDLR